MSISEREAEAAQRFRKVFSHLESPGQSINAWLTDEQQVALDEYHAALNFTPNRDGHLPPGTMPAEKDLVHKFRVQLEDEGALQSPQDKAYATDLRLLQYLRARDLHLDKAHAMFIHTLQWRREAKPWQLENVDSRTNKTVSDARIVGFDPKGRVVAYSSFSNTTKRTPHDVEVNAAATMEKAALCITAQSAGDLIWVNNFCAWHKNGFGWRDCNPAFFFSGINMFSNHYPECLKTMAICDPPSIFFNTWGLVKPLLPVKTQQKAVFINSRQEAKAKQQLKDEFGEELGEFLFAQIRKDS